ncbi:MAG TPA: 2Fe-2S iron-sulfur cluster-binding protein, partial [Thermoanaerobaculia bacterium]|nr:2Fe-2S iron-sulfur cluster-binding protein [Thermoanaerobaculia bacterium]
MNALSKHVTFVPLGRDGAAKDDETLLDVARRAGAPLANSCGGVGVCARCRVRVIEGAESLSAPTSVETRFSRGFQEGERMACQAVVTGDCAVTT